MKSNAVTKRLSTFYLYSKKRTKDSFPHLLSKIRSLDIRQVNTYNGSGLNYAQVRNPVPCKGTSLQTYNFWVNQV